jgi:hypothetical protein
MHSTSSESLAAPAAAPKPALRTWHLFALLSLAGIALAWANNEFVMTREVYHNVMGKQLDRDRIDAHFSLMQQMAAWGYAAVPLVLWVRIALVALTVQMLALLALKEIPFRQLFRAASWAFCGILYGTVVRVLWLVRLGPGEITEQTLAVTPGSVAALLMEPGQAGSLSYTLLSLLNGSELVWAAILAVCLVRGARVGKAGAVGLVACTWLLLALLQGGLAAYLSGVAS